MITGIVVAAGSGERLAAGVPKGFVVLAGEPLLVHAARALAPSCDAVVVVVGEGQVAAAGGVLAAAGLDAFVCAGGATRTDSVAAGLAACPSGTEVVAVHDAARPLAGERLIRRTVAALQAPWDAVAPGLQVVDTLKLVDPAREGRVVRTVDRRSLWTVQTPQVFASATLERAHVGLGGDAVTDDLELVERAGGRVRLVAGERRNLKVTFPEDLAIAAALLAAGRAASGRVEP